MTATLMVNEVFYSIQGESTRTGLPCVFVRLMGCHLRCGYCDTEYAFHEGRRRTIDELVEEVERIGPSAPAGGLVEITGGEPLLQPGVHPLMTRLCDAGRTVLIETSGACDIARCDPRVVRVMDLKTPGSGEAERMRWSNLEHLREHDEVKFVLTSRVDYEWARRIIREHDLSRRVNAVLLSAVEPVPTGPELPGCEGLALRDLAGWLLADGLDARIQTQLHKLIWDPSMRGV